MNVRPKAAFEVIWQYSNRLESRRTETVDAFDTLDARRRIRAANTISDNKRYRLVNVIQVRQLNAEL